MPIAIRINDPDDPRIAAYRDIRERDLVGRHGRFIAEGTVVLAQLFAAGRFAVESLLVLENRLDGLAGLLAQVPQHVPLYVADRSVLDAIAGFPMHRGVLAIGRRGETPPVELFLQGLGQNATVVVCIGIANHDNIGSIFRNAAAFGADAVLIDANLLRSALPQGDQGFGWRRAQGAVLHLRRSGETGGDAGRPRFRQFALSPAGEQDLRDVEGGRQERRSISGTEGAGLPGSLIDRLVSVRIPIAAGFDSLNVAAASAIALVLLDGRLTPMRPAYCARR